MERLDELSDCCRNLDADKVTERKKQAKRLEIVLKKQAVIVQLHKNTTVKGKLRWTDVFRAVSRCVMKDVEHQRQLDNKRTVTGSSSKSPNINSVSLFRLVVHIANQNQPRIKCTDIVQRIIIAVTDEYNLEKIGDDYTYVLLHEVLNVRKLWVELSSKTCQELLQIYCALYVDPPARWNKNITAQIINRLICIVIAQFNIRLNSLFKFFEQALKECGNHHNGAVMEPLFAAAVAFVSYMAPNYRMRTCKFGEEVSTSLLQIWKYCPREITKLHIVRFLQYQLVVHHPNGTKTESEGAFSCNWVLWKKLLKQIYDLLYHELEQVANSNKHLKRIQIVHQEMVNLLADVCHQIFTRSQSSIEVTQLDSSLKETSPSRWRKKRKIQTGFSALCEKIKDMAGGIEIIPWLQLIDSLLAMYPDSITVDQYVVALQTAHHIQLNCKRSEVTSQVLKLLMRVTKCHQILADSINSFEMEQITNLWTNIENIIIRSVSLNNCKEEGFKLLNLLINEHLLSRPSEVMSLFGPQLRNFPSTESVLLLASFIQSTYLRKCKNFCSIFATDSVRIEKKYLIRASLIDWLLPKDYDNQWTEISSSFVTQVSSTKISQHNYYTPNPYLHRVIAELLVCLCVKNTVKLELENKEVIKSNFDQDFDFVQQSIREMTFDVPFSLDHPAESTFHGETSLCRKHTKIELLFEDVLQKVIRDCSLALSLCIHGDNATAICVLSHQSCFVMCLIQSFFNHKIMNDVQVKDCMLYKLLNNMMKKLSEIMKDITEDDASIYANVVCLSQVLDNLYEMFSLKKSTSGEDCNFLSQLWRSVTPSSLLNDLLSILNVTSKCSSNSMPALNGSKKVASVSSDDDDDDLKCFKLSGQSLNADIEDDHRLIEFNNDSNSDQECEPDNLDWSKLVELEPESKIQGLRVKIAKLLSHWCFFTDAFKSPDSTLVSSYNTFENIMKYLNRKELDVNDPNVLQLILVFLKALTAEEQRFDQMQFGSILEVLRTVSKAHIKDQMLVAELVKMLSNLFHHMSSLCILSSSIVQLEINRKHALFLLNLFLNINEKSEPSQILNKMLTECIIKLLKCDYGGWAVVPSAGTASENDDCNCSRHLTKIMMSRSHCVRAIAARSSWLLFFRPNVDGSTRAFSAISVHEQDRNLELVLSSCFTLLSSKEKSTDEDELSDIMIGKISSVLLCFRSLICINTYCRPKILFSLCQIVHDYEASVALIAKVLDQVTSLLKYPLVEELFRENLGYVLHNWLKSSMPLCKFPYKLLKMQTLSDFYQVYGEAIVSELIAEKDVEAIEHVATTLNVEWKKLILDNLPAILARIIPYFAIKEGQKCGVSSIDLQHAMSCHKYLEDIVTTKVIRESRSNKLDIIVTNLLNLLCETSDDAESDTSSKFIPPAYRFPSFSSGALNQTLKYLTELCCTEQSKTLVQLLCKMPNGVHGILFSLSSNISKAHQLHEMRRALLIYGLFVRLLLPEFQQNTMNGCWVFILRDIIYTVVHHINDFRFCDVRFVIYAMDLLKDICHSAVKYCSQEMCKHMSVIVDALVPIIKKNHHGSSQGVAIMKFLITDSKDRLKQAIATLDPFPAMPEFNECEKVRIDAKYFDGPFSLNEEFEHFVNTKYTNRTEMHRVEGLKHLLNQVRTRKEELQSIVEKFQGVKMLSEETMNSVFHQLMYKLIRLATQQNDKEVSIEACRCLGDIGPVDLSSVVLMSEQVIRHSKFHMFPDYQSYHMYTVLKSLNTLLVDADYMVKHAAGSVLKHILTISSVSVYLSSSEDEEIRDIYPYIKPFIIKNKSVQKPTFDIRNACDVIGNELLWMPNHDDHNRWITELVCTLIMSGAVNDEVLNLVEPVCRVNVEFCEEILSFVIWSIIQRDSQSIIDVLSAQISTFFRKRCECITSQDNQEKLATTIIMNKQSVRAMIGVVQYLRLQKTSSVQRKDKTTPWDDNFWLNVDYLDIAEAARFCSAYFTSLLYCEIWIEQYKQNIDEEFASISASQESQWTSTIENLKSDDAKRVQNLLNDAYSSIGDPDSIYGCRFLHKIDFSNRIRRYKQEKNWEKLIAAYDLELSFNPNASNYGGLLNSLQCHGFNHILEKYLNGLNAEDDLNGAQEFQQFQYECAWRNGTWDLPDLENDTEVPNYHKILHQCLCNLKEGDYDGALQNVECGRLSVVQVLTTESLAVTRKVYPELSKLQCLSILEEASNCCLATDIPKTQEMWNSWDKLSVNEFEFVEPILTMECIVIQTEMARNSNPIILSSFLQHRLQTFAKLARLTGHYQVAERCLSNLKQISADIYGMTMWSWKLEEAELMWARAETNLAVQLIKSLLNDLTKTNELEKHVSQFSPRVLTVYGKWLAETCSESPVIIFNNYLDKAALMLNKLTDEDKHPMLDTYLTLARYSDLQHQNITDYLKSPTYQSKRELINRSRHELLLLNGIEKLTQKEKEARRMHCKHIEMDEAEIKAMHNDRDGFLLKSIQNYIQCLCLGDDYILSVCRLISLWFQSASDVNVSSLIKENIDRIPSYKFLPLMYQLAARMSIGSSQGEMFQDILQELILKTTKDHPYHTLLIIFALANAPKDMEFDAECKIALSRNQHCHQPEAQDDRVLAAQEIIDKLSKDSHENLIGGLDQMCDAYIKLAYMNVANPKINPSIGIPIPRNQPILQLQNIPGIPVPTANVQVDKSAVYRDIPTILSIQRTYNLCGGVSLPKKIICSGSDGKSYIQLVKGKDDLRQDAVMQQFFSLVNNLLKQDDDMKRRKLNMRTYKVIPLSRRSGIVQWCDGTQPFASYLVESGKSIGAHRLYHPSDLTSNQCRKKLMVCAPSSNQVKLAQYNEVCSKFRPVFRHFFFENFRDPSVWFERRLSYTQSVATCSVVGYILGLGDRHVQNILIDKKTAEFIHIDLGIAFEQGKLLPTPETVPFRLTRDVVDGMGVSGVEGVFRRCAEKTMEVMHKSREVLLTIPQVLLYDPLYKWLISQEKVAKVQGLKFKTDTETVSSSNAKLGERRQLTTTTNTNAQDEPEINKIAERVLLRLKEKLQGVEKGTVMSVNGQINYLIQEAMDPNNLSRLYHGWQPYL